MNRIRKLIVEHVGGLYGDRSRDGGGLIQTERPLDRKVEVDAAAELERAGLDERLQACDRPWPGRPGGLRFIRQHLGLLLRERRPCRVEIMTGLFDCRVVHQKPGTSESLERRAMQQRIERRTLAWAQGLAEPIIEREVVGNERERHRRIVAGRRDRPGDAHRGVVRALPRQVVDRHLLAVELHVAVHILKRIRELIKCARSVTDVGLPFGQNRTWLRLPVIVQHRRGSADVNLRAQ